MPRLGDKVLDKLGTGFGQVLDFSALPTSPLCGFAGSLALYPKSCSVFTQLKTSFTHAKISSFYLLFTNLFTFSTTPITNTNLIKGLYL
jgi:hypothetical protein